jgi:hypothetical protein
LGNSNGSLFFRSQPGGIVGDDGAVRDDAAPSGFGQTPQGGNVFVNRNGPCSTDPTFEFGNRADFSLEIWIRPGSNGATYKGGIIGNYAMEGSGSYNVGYGLYLNWPVGTAGTLTFERHDATSQGFDTVSTSVAADQWSHVVATYDGTEMALYLNGTLAGQTMSTRNLPTAACTVRVGAFSFDFGVTDYPGYFYGSLDEAAVYDRALTAQEIAAHFQAASASPGLEVTPTSAQVLAGGTHSVTARIVGTQPQAGVPVTFQVEGANPQTFVSSTDSGGSATLSYIPDFLGIDTITASAIVGGTTLSAQAQAVVGGISCPRRIQVFPGFTDSYYFDGADDPREALMQAAQLGARWE